MIQFHRNQGYKVMNLRGRGEGLMKEKQCRCGGKVRLERNTTKQEGKQKTPEKSRKNSENL